MKKSYLASAVAVAAVAAQAGIMDEPAGIKMLNERLTLSPYVALSYTYDSNIDQSKHSKSGSQWSVNPGINATYKGENWKLDGMVFYKYHAYNRYTSQLNSSSYGERMKFTWASAAADEPGWRVMFSENFQQIAQDDDASNHDGRGIGRDRKQFQAEGAIERRINRYFHAAATANYYLLDYDNDVDKYATMYGWKRLSIGGEIGYTASKWSDIILAADYQWYWQDNNHGSSSYGEASRRGHDVSSDSKGFSVMGGIGSHMTERIEYRVLAGWSRFEYGDGAKDLDGWTYRANAKWQLDDANTLNIMALGSSYYQPSERSYGSAIKVYTASIGAAKGLVRNTINATVDLSYRRETHEYTEYSADAYDEDIITARIGLSYKINRIASVYGNLEYQTEETSNGHGIGHTYDYDRFRGTVGVRLTY
ncbi:MAG: outer membrane beta-barrel protein [Kiritimatiellae bacterium]|nr:outer membrane beta-barrel protein [Kiritimatiellia bacterium]